MSDLATYMVVVTWEFIMLFVDYEPIEGAQRISASAHTFWGLLLRTFLFHVIASGVILSAAWITNAYTNYWWTKTLAVAQLEEPELDFGTRRDTDTWKTHPRRVRLLTRRRFTIRMASCIPWATPRAVFETISECLLMALNHDAFTFVTIMATWHIVLSYLMEMQWMKDIVWGYLAHYGLSGATYTCFTAPFVTTNLTFLMGIYGLARLTCGFGGDYHYDWEFPLFKLFAFYSIAGAYSIFLPNVLGLSVDRARLVAALADPNLLPPQPSRLWYLLGWKFGGAGVRGT
ncbi:hypothetical protein AURDEDRAFT_157515 [Auricularia subglabra TFB-10046 SS5]|nr:hypothetical protein AURDEDRAFT_157515 [Auricularia subglabra TFB-10046 SS5]